MDLIKSHRRSIVLILTPLLLLPVLPLHAQIGITPRACNCLYMLLLMAVYWCTDIVPLAITALIPLALAPLMGILEASHVSKNYFKDIIVLFVGSLILATSVQQCGLHRRVALTFIKMFGTNPRFLMIGFMIPTWFLSMWISNTATSVMMVSILNCVIMKLKEHSDVEAEPGAIPLESALKDSSPNLAKADDVEVTVASSNIEEGAVQYSKKFQATAKSLCLAVCYSATCGGIATLTGTGTNLIFYDNVAAVGKRLNFNFNVNFPSWIGFAMPISILIMVICWGWLQILFFSCRKSMKESEGERQKLSRIINEEYSSLGQISWAEGICLVHFVVLIVLWLSRDPGKVGGWGKLFPKGFVTDATSAMFVSISLLFMPKYPPLLLRRPSSRAFESLLPWTTVSEKLPWGVVFLIAGGLALADCVDKSGLSEAIGNGLSVFSDLPIWALVLLLSIITAGITEFTSNVVVNALIQPILADMAIRMRLHPLQLMLPCSMASNFAFMLPVATPPNAVVYSSGVLKIKDMVAAGALLNVLSVLIVVLASLTWGPSVFDFSSFSYNTTLSGNLTDALVRNGTGQ